MDLQLYKAIWSLLALQTSEPTYVDTHTFLTPAAFAGLN
jgi:hypothetical protein